MYNKAPNDPLISPITIPITLYFQNSSLPVQAMIDSGATISFMHQNLAQQYDLPVAKQSLQISLANGSTHVSQTATTLVMQSSPEHFSTQTFQLITLGNYSIILGMDWLRAHNPQIDWEKRTITMPCIHQHTFDKLTLLAKSTMPKVIPPFSDPRRRLKPPPKPKSSSNSDKSASQRPKRATRPLNVDIAIVSNAQFCQILKTNQAVGYMLNVSQIEDLASVTVDGGSAPEEKPTIQLPEKYAEYAQVFSKTQADKLPTPTLRSQYPRGRRRHRAIWSCVQLIACRTQGLT